MDLFSVVEWIGVITALIYVLLATKGLRLCFLFGLISSVLFVIVCAIERLYFDTGINAYYVVMSVVGWINWKPENGSIHVERTKPILLLYILIAAVLAALLTGYLSNEYTDASLPYLDAFTTMLAIAATWLLVKRKIENWVIWIVADALSINLYYIKGLYPISGLFLIYTIIAVYGYYSWRKILKEE